MGGLRTAPSVCWDGCVAGSWEGTWPLKEVGKQKLHKFWRGGAVCCSPAEPFVWFCSLLLKTGGVSDRSIQQIAFLNMPGTALSLLHHMLPSSRGAKDCFWIK